MEYALEERIGNPDLFTGRKAELSFFLRWIEDIKERKSQSTAIMARRKMGKTALMERLFNITFHKNDGVIPFYYEIKERDTWIGDFCVDFFLTFIYQYIAFKTRNPRYLRSQRSDFESVKEVATKECLDYLIETIESVEYCLKNEHVDLLWERVRQAPKDIAYNQGEFIVQMIDEFQFLNATIYWNKGKSKKQLARNLAGGYLSTAESKVAPLLVSGSWVGWLMNELNMMLPARFKYEYLGNMPEDEAIEMVYKYSHYFDAAVTEETAYLIVKLAEGSPFYISSIMRSSIDDKDLTSIKGLTDTLEFETLNNRGAIKSTWMEYVDAAFPRINDHHAKNIVLHLCKNRDRELTRKEILEDLHLNMTDAILEKKLKALVKVDIIKQGKSNYRYQGVNDNIFDKVFRGVYEEEIREFEMRTIREEYREELEDLKKQYAVIEGGNITGKKDTMQMAGDWLNRMTHQLSE